MVSRDPDARDADIQCYVQIPLIVGLASRNNTISYLTGISYQNLNYLHRAAGRVCFLFAWIHTISYCVMGLGKHGPGNRVFTTVRCSRVVLLQICG